MTTTYSIRTLAREFDVTARTLRFYEAEGILHPERRGTTRLFSEQDRERLALALQRSIWQLSVRNPAGELVGFVRATSDLALNANLWNLSGHPGDPHRDQVVLVLVHTALQRLRRELPGCSISLSAPPEAVKALSQQGFVVDPGGIRAMGLGLT
jgi:hypothetical protein